jgi:transcriptional regulator with XRE-family HTH domain
MLIMSIEERLQTLRRAKGLSQEQLAEVLGVSRQAVSKWESGQSLPEIEKLIAMSELFEVSIDHILKGTALPPHKGSRSSAVVGSQVISAVAAMLLAVGIIATVGQLSDGMATMDIYGGLVIESVGIMLLLIGFFVGGGRILSKPLFVVNNLLAGNVNNLRRKPKDNSKFIIHHFSFFIFHYKNFAK